MTALKNILFYIKIYLNESLESTVHVSIHSHTHSLILRWVLLSLSWITLALSWITLTLSWVTLALTSTILRSIPLVMRVLHLGVASASSLRVVSVSAAADSDDNARAADQKEAASQDIVHGLL